MPELTWRRYSLDEETEQLIDALRPILAETETEAERLRHMPDAAVDAIRESGLWTTASPREAGGREAPALLEFEIYEAVSRIATAAGWTVFIGSFHTALPLAYVGDAAVKAMLADESPPVVAGQLGPIGRFRQDEGGLVVSGSYSWGSGINHATWVAGGARADDGGATPQAVIWVAPKEHVEVKDNWHVSGLAGSGSFDYAVDELYVPDGFWFDFEAPIPQRGGARYLAPMPLQGVPCHCGVALGAGERALNLIAELAGVKKRQFSPNPLASRGAFQRDLGAKYHRLAAARSYVADLLSEFDEVPWPEQPEPEKLAVALLGAIAYSTEVAVHVASAAYRYAGGSAARLDSPLQRILRDLLVAQQHLIAADTSYDAIGQWLIAHTSGEPVPEPAGSTA